MPGVLAHSQERSLSCLPLINSRLPPIARRCRERQRQSRSRRPPPSLRVTCRRILNRASPVTFLVLWPVAVREHPAVARQMSNTCQGAPRQRSTCNHGGCSHTHTTAFISTDASLLKRARKLSNPAAASRSRFYQIPVANGFYSGFSGCLDALR